MTTRSCAVLITVAAGVVISACTLPPHAEPEQRQVEAPLLRLQVGHHADGTPEILAELASGVTLGRVLAMDVFSGFSADLSPDAAQVRHGQPSGMWLDPIWGSNSPYFEEPLARISLGQFYGSDGKPGWKTVAYPKRTVLPKVIVDEHLRKQLVAAIPSGAEADVVVARPIGYGRVQLFMTRESCRAIIRLEDGA